jgi:nucleotide-binding universal stress UspA family protein
MDENAGNQPLGTPVAQSLGQGYDQLRNSTPPAAFAKDAQLVRDRDNFQGEEPSDMKLEHIVAATDFSDTSDRAMALAGKLAVAAGARLSLVHVYDPTPLGPAVAYPAQVWTGADLAKQLETASKRELERTRSEILARVKRVEPVTIAHSSSALAICDYAEEVKADLVVTGTHGRGGLAHMLIGSVAENIVRHAPCPVLAVRPSATVDGFPGRIVAATDFSPNANAGLDWARDLSDRFDTEVTMVHVYDTWPQTIGGERFEFERLENVDANLKAALAEAQRERFGGRETVKTELLAGDAAGAVCEYARDTGAGLVVVTTHGRTGLKRLILGSVAEKIVRHAPCSVLVARVD